MSEMCVRCHEIEEDSRTLWMACLYDMNELQLPFEKKQIKDEDDNFHRFYTMRVCKDCRADWMTAIQKWFNTGKQHIPSCGSGIYIRRNGATIEVTEEEWHAMHPQTEPVRFKSDKEIK